MRENAINDAVNIGLVRDSCQFPGEHVTAAVECKA
jgi:hypothetical protein